MARVVPVLTVFQGRPVAAGNPFGGMAPERRPVVLPQLFAEWGGNSSWGTR